jgi:hypothetical protein
MYFDFISKHYLYVSSIGFFSAIISALGTLFFLAESPLWQLKMGKHEEGKTTIRNMCRMNGVEAEIEIDELDILLYPN